MSGNKFFNFIRSIEVKQIELLFAFGALVIALYVYFATVDQVKISREALELAKQSDSATNVITQKSIALAESSFVLTKKSIDMAQQNVRIENRPYIYVDFNNIVSKVTDDSIEVVLTYKNAGKTPAINFKCAFNYIVDSALQKRYVDSVDIHMARDNKYIVVGVNQSQFLDFVSNLDHWKEFKNFLIHQRFEKFHLYLIVRMTYEDIFGRKHFTNMCGYMDTKSVKWTMYSKYNDAD